jgi:hypothetical protein
MRRAWTFAVDDLDGVTFAGSDLAEHCLAGHAELSGGGVQRQVAAGDVGLEATARAGIEALSRSCSA